MKSLTWPWNVQTANNLKHFYAWGLLEEFQSNNKIGAYFKQYKKEKLVLLYLLIKNHMIYVYVCSVLMCMWVQVPWGLRGIRCP